MGLWSFLFGPRGPEPVQQVDTPQLGTLSWDPDEESWVGEFAGYRIALGFSKSATPDPELVQYAHDFLGSDGASFASNFKDAQNRDAAEFKSFEDEFSRLTIGMIHFAKSSRGVGCLIELIGGKRDRSWRVEFDGHTCLGFGFDT